MTSSKRHLPPESPKWDSNKHQFKPHDALCEPGLISILFLAHGNHSITKHCLESIKKSCDLYTGELEFCFMENGLDDANWRLFQSFSCERKKLIRSDNWGIMSALNDLWNVSRGEYCLTLENDFYNTNTSFNFLQTAKDILDEFSEVGMVHLRQIADPFENWGFMKKEYNPFSIIGCDKLWWEQTKAGHKFMIADYPNKYNNNPNLMKKKLWRECGYFSEPMLGTCPKHDESHYNEKVNKTDCVAAHIVTDLFVHIGGSAKQSFLKQVGEI